MAEVSWDVAREFLRWTSPVRPDSRLKFPALPEMDRPGAAVGRAQSVHHDRMPARHSGSGGARAPSGRSGAAYSSGAVRSRWASLRAITPGSSRLAMILSRPPQRTQFSIWIPNTRAKRRAQLIVT